MAITIRAQKIHPEAQLPRYAHTGPFGDLAADLHAVSTKLPLVFFRGGYGAFEPHVTWLADWFAGWG